MSSKVIYRIRVGLVLFCYIAIIDEVTGYRVRVGGVVLFC